MREYPTFEVAAQIAGTYRLTAEARYRPATQRAARPGLAR